MVVQRASQSEKLWQIDAKAERLSTISISGDGPPILLMREAFRKIVECVSTLVMQREVHLLAPRAWRGPTRIPARISTSDKISNSSHGQILNLSPEDFAPLQFLSCSSSSKSSPADLSLSNGLEL